MKKNVGSIDRTIHAIVGIVAITAYSMAMVNRGAKKIYIYSFRGKQHPGYFETTTDAFLILYITPG
ncbi:MAG: DUF2892 domain-containing protein [Proteobacteria bacterium]|nr:DUF2892 domain-containing protein [Pseudomonadota bacterium]